MKFFHPPILKINPEPLYLEPHEREKGATKQYHSWHNKTKSRNYEITVRQDVTQK